VQYESKAKFALQQLPQPPPLLLLTEAIMAAVGARETACLTDLLAAPVTLADADGNQPVQPCIWHHHLEITRFISGTATKELSREDTTSTDILNVLGVKLDTMLTLDVDVSTVTRPGHNSCVLLGVTVGLLKISWKWGTINTGHFVLMIR